VAEKRSAGKGRKEIHGGFGREDSPGAWSMAGTAKSRSLVVLTRWQVGAQQAAPLPSVRVLGSVRGGHGTRCAVRWRRGDRLGKVAKRFTGAFGATIELVQSARSEAGTAKSRSLVVLTRWQVGAQQAAPLPSVRVLGSVRGGHGTRCAVRWRRSDRLGKVAKRFTGALHGTTCYGCPVR
jgi:hypothetical protein